MNEDCKQVVLIGAGIMSATLAVMLKELLPAAQVSLYECLDEAAAESSNALNNSGTGHAAYCELNYTPMSEGQVIIGKALEIAERFEISMQLWAYLKKTGRISFQHAFIHRVPHMSFVWGDDNVQFLRKRFDAMREVAIFRDMQFSDDDAQIQEWAPLIVEGRHGQSSLAATRMEAGTDIDFGAITRDILHELQHSGQADINLAHRVIDIERQKSGRWRLHIEDSKHGHQKMVEADHVFIGAGGGSLPLLRKTGIDEARGYAGFPVSGQFLVCRNPAIAQRHFAKVYGMAEVGAPPMSVPHLDTRIIDGQRILFFGPYAGFTTRFLKNGSYLDLLLSLGMDNIWPMLAATLHNRDLAGYLIRQLMQSPEQRFKALKAYYPDARREDWSLIIAGQRVQIIKKSDQKGGVLKFGTEIVSSEDGSVVSLLGASPGASTSVSIALDVIASMFPDKISSRAWQQILQEMIPTYGKSLIDDDKLCLATRAQTHEILQLD